MNESTPTWLKFENLVGQILEQNGFKVRRHSPRGDLGFDLIGQFDKEKWAIEVKYYRTPRAQPRLVEAAAARVVANGVKEKLPKGMLVISSALSAELRQALEKKFGIVFVDRIDLEVWSSKSPKLAAELGALLESDPNLHSAASPPREIQVTQSQGLSEERVVELERTGENLCIELSKIEKGIDGWPGYERHCEKVLKYLFPNDLQGWHRQKRTDDGLNRFDFICRIRSTNEFWRFLIDHLDSRYVLFEFKNYKEKIKQGQILTTERYLLSRGLRRTALILTREGGDRNAVQVTQGAMREHGKLMLILDDKKVCEMLHKRDRGEDPSDVLFEIADDFLMSLPR